MMQFIDFSFSDIVKYI